MLRFCGRLLLWVRGETLRLLLLAVAVLLIWGVVSPVGTLVWWLRQGAENLGLKQAPPTLLPAKATSARSAAIDCYIVFLPGVGDFSADRLADSETLFLSRLIQRHPNCVAVPDVFPYSAANESLGGRRVLAPLWSTANQASGWLKNANALIKIRNLWRFAIAADDRYGSIYSQGIARAIIDRMNAAHPLPQRQQQPLNLLLIGTSGGVEVALGAADHLDQWLHARLTVVSIGGVFNGEAGFNVVDHVYHLQGQQDWVEDLSRIAFPACWQWKVHSPFNQARQRGRYTVISSGPHAHDGDRGYFGEAIATNHTTYVELTLQKVDQLPIWTRPTQGR